MRRNRHRAEGRVSSSRAIAAILAVLIAVCACERESSGPGVEPIAVRALPAELAPDAKRLVAANNRFAFDLYRQLHTEEGNLFFSPFSVATALGMTLAGARGDTEREMVDVLRLDIPWTAVGPAAGALLGSLDRGAALGGYRLDIANRLWGHEGYSFQDEFLATTRDRYDAELARLDFQGAPEAARGTINRWVEEQTENRIQELLPQGFVGPDTRLILTNAIYFKGDWASKFDPSTTRTGSFRVSPSETVSVSMMTRDGDFRAALRNEVSVLELPYAGNDLSMIVLLPNNGGGLRSLEERLNAEYIDGWVAALDSTRLYVTIPRFSMTSTFSLGETLAAMGMPSAFDPNSADFSGMTGNRDLFIGGVVHKAFVEVNEEGTEAAAATGVGMRTVSMPPSFTADHPFVFVIRDNLTGSVLFVGRVSNPA